MVIQDDIDKRYEIYGTVIFISNLWLSHYVPSDTFPAGLLEMFSTRNKYKNCVYLHGYYISF